VNQTWNADAAMETIISLAFIGVRRSEYIPMIRYFGTSLIVANIKVENILECAEAFYQGLQITHRFNN
jgi:hypothetical protein